MRIDAFLPYKFTTLMDHSLKFGHTCNINSDSYSRAQVHSSLAGIESGYLFRTGSHRGQTGG